MRRTEAADRAKVFGGMGEDPVEGYTLSHRGNQGIRARLLSGEERGGKPRKGVVRTIAGIH